MRARITIDVIGDNGHKVREQRIVEVSKRVVHIYESVDTGGIEKMVAQDMLSHALRAVEPSVRVQQSMPAAGPSAGPVRRNTGIAATLGLDLIDEAVAHEGPDRQMGPGPIGFGRPGERR